MTLTPFEGCLAAMADSEFSWPFYCTALFQLALLGLSGLKPVRNHTLYKMLIGISLLVLPAFLSFGFYYATRPVA